VSLSRTERDRRAVGATDADLLELVAAGELGALGQLFDRHADAVRRVVVRLGVGPAEVDDLVQDVFLEVVRAAARFDGRESARAWLAGFAVIHVRRHRRSLARLARKLASWARERETVVPSPEAEHEERVEAARAMRALDRLSAKKREAFVLVTLEGLPGDEVARALGVPVATVWTRLFHARRELREALEAEGER
jgi:RNA polymerase sigma-70 factor (ECF subfamily)